MPAPDVHRHAALSLSASAVVVARRFVAHDVVHPGAHHRPPCVRPNWIAGVSDPLTVRSPERVELRSRPLRACSLALRSPNCILRQRCARGAGKISGALPTRFLPPPFDYLITSLIHQRPIAHQLRERIRPPPSQTRRSSDVTRLPNPSYTSSCRLLCPDHCSMCFVG